MFGQHADFLGRSTTFEFGISVGEYASSALGHQFLNGWPDALCTFKIVDAMGVALTQGLTADAFHLVPVDLQSGGKYKEVIFNNLSACCTGGLFDGIQLHNRILYPFYATGDAL